MENDTQMKVKGSVLGLVMAALVMLVAYLLAEGPLFDGFSTLIGDGKDVALAMFFPFLGLLEAIEVWSWTSWLWLLGIVVVLLLVYLVIAKVLLNFGEVREMDREVIVPIAWTIYYFTLLGCCYGIQLLLSLNPEFYWYALFGGVAYLVLAIFTQPWGVKSFLINLLLILPIAILCAAIFIAVGIVFSWIVLVCLVVAIFSGKFSISSSGKSYKLSDGTKVEKKEGLFGDATYHDAAGNTYRETGSNNEVKKQ